MQQDAAPLSREELVRLQRNAFEVAWLPNALKDGYLAELDQYAHSGNGGAGRGISGESSASGCLSSSSRTRRSCGGFAIIPVPGGQATLPDRGSGDGRPPYQMIP